MLLGKTRLFKRKAIATLNFFGELLAAKQLFSRVDGLVIGKDGKIAYKNTKVKPAKDSQQVLEFIRNSDSSEQ